MADSSKPPTVIVCGREENVGKMVVKGLMPDYEVILFCKGAEHTVSEIPYALRNEAPPEQSSYIGSNDFGRAPIAVIMGAAWDAADCVRVRDAVAAASGSAGAGRPLVLRNDTSVPAPTPPAPEYGQQLVRRIKATLGRVAEGEKLDGPEEGIVWY
ncbi:hypothetical protein F4819DRAFT_39897 [Hypoxylon fuscum]|nr:hypothetical protein F4819DRAFT_39897 [Hypoxylon fuscum]